MNKFNIKYVDKLSGRQFELYCGWIFKLAFHEPKSHDVRVTPASNDHGADILVNDKQRSNQFLAMQCKHTCNSYKMALGYKALEETAAGKAYYHATWAAIVANGYFSTKMIKDAKRMHLHLLDRSGLKIMIHLAHEIYLQKQRQTLHISKNSADLLDDIMKQYKLNCKRNHEPITQNRKAMLHGILKDYDYDLYVQTHNSLPPVNSPVFVTKEQGIKFYKEKERMCNGD